MSQSKNQPKKTAKNQSKRLKRKQMIVAVMAGILALGMVVTTVVSSLFSIM
ncbi:MAG: hypothetical protein IJ468_13360 [Lachnospiraceae bacterium]|nr:hypothetical protein [Lachnospiraceae bacterium]